jgi:site-specific recombinase XerD
MRHLHPSHKKFTSGLLEKFITSRPQGTSARSIEAYHYTLDSFVDYPITAQGITAYLKSLTCNNGKAKLYSCLRALCNWLHQNGYIPSNPIKQVSSPKTQKRLIPAVSIHRMSTSKAYHHLRKHLYHIKVVLSGGNSIAIIMEISSTISA